MVPNHKKLTIADVKALGRALIETANAFPLRFVTEKDFFPLVMTYLSGRVPSVKPEVATKEGAVDFHLGGNNPTLLELAVQPRVFLDKNNAEVCFPGGNAKNSLYACTNRSELNKLRRATLGRTRFLLLVDLNGGYDLQKLKAAYQQEMRRFRTGSGVRVVYVSALTDTDFLASPKRA